MLSIIFISHTEKTTIIIGGLSSDDIAVTSVEYFGPLDITIPRLSALIRIKTAAYVDGILYGCGRQRNYIEACFKYELAADSGSWDLFMTIPFSTMFSNAVAIDDFFWYFSDKIIQVPVHGNNVISYGWSLGSQGCAVGNGSHTVIIQNYNSSVLINKDPSSPYHWTTAVVLNTAVSACGCLWLDNTIYVTGGMVINDRTNLTQLINTNTFTVTLGAALPVSLAYHGMGVIDGRPAVIGGIMNKGASSAIFVFDSSANTWSLSEESLSAELSYFASVTF